MDKGERYLVSYARIQSMYVFFLPINTLMITFGELCSSLKGGQHGTNRREMVSVNGKRVDD